jgi:hypothetical protein
MDLCTASYVPVQESRVAVPNTRAEMPRQGVTNVWGGTETQPSLGAYAAGAGFLSAATLFLWILLKDWAKLVAR